MRRAAVALLALVVLPLAAPECEPTPPPADHVVVFGDFTLRYRVAESTRLTRTRFRYRFDAEIENRGPAVRELEVLVVSTMVGTRVVEGSLAFGDLARDGVAPSARGFAIVQDRRAPFDPSDLLWLYTAEVARDAEGFEIDPPGAWYAGDLHVHASGASNDTDGISFPEDIARIARERGLFFVVLTDHSNSTGSDPFTTDEDPALFNMGPEFPYWDLAASLSEPGAFLMVDGNELSPRRPDTGPTGHVGCIPPVLDGFDLSGAFVDRPFGAVNGAETVAQANARDCFTVVNHPYGPLPWTRYDWTSFQYDAMEVWNGGAGIGFSPTERAAHDAWRCDLVAGRDVVPLGTSDVHRVFTEPPGFLGSPALGWPRTSVFSAAPDWPGLVAGLSAGHVVVHEGDSWLELDGYDAARLRAESGTVREIRLRGRLDVRAASARLVLSRATGCVDRRPRGDTAPVEVVEDVLLDEPMAPGASFDRAVAIPGDAGVYTATLIPESPVPIHYVALSRALVIRTVPGP